MLFLWGMISGVVLGYIVAIGTIALMMAAKRGDKQLGYKD